MKAELKQLKDKDYEGIIALKERKVAELTDTIGRLQAGNEAYKDNPIQNETDNLEKFLGISIANKRMKKTFNKK